jgi:cell division protein FtsZ
VGDDAEIIFGAGNDPAMHGEVRVTVIATGFDRALPVEHQPAAATMGRPSGPAGILNFPTTRGRPSTPVPQPPGAHPQAPQPIARPQPRAPQAPPAAGPPAETPEMEIPTFIRRQMD